MKKTNTIKDWALDDRPREKMMKKGYAALSDAELLAILIQSGTKEKSAVDLAREILLMGNHNLSFLGKLALKDFQTIRGIGVARAIAIAAALELGRRRQLSESMEQKIVASSKRAADILFPLLSDLQHEKFVILCLGRNNKLFTLNLLVPVGLLEQLLTLKLFLELRCSILQVTSLLHTIIRPGILTLVKRTNK